ncbi:MAG: hypothetical protein Q4D48_00850 [Coriobacteriales bacterium]|nr:hypothetical protein [Coriobacteriales bacterium]
MQHKLMTCSVTLALGLTLAACSGLSSNQGKVDNSSGRPEDTPSMMLPTATYQLQGAQEVDGRQGVAAEGSNIWISGSTTLSRYDNEWNFRATNADPFSKGYELEVNHIGDIDVYNGEVYCGVERFVDGEATNIQIAIYNGNTLELDRTFNFEPESGQDECSGICVNPDDGTVWMSSWTDTGRYLYQYDLETGAYLRSVHLHAAPQWIQGVAYHDGAFYLTADDGDADFGEPDHVYRAIIKPDATECTVTLERTLDDVTLQGEIEGLTFTDSGDLLVLYNRGARIILGMPNGFYEGYDHEIHEVFTYTATPRNNG